MILVPGGRKCYCGKKGCADAYCAASALTDGKYESLELFMEALSEGNTKAQKKWADYLDNLAILISNLRMAFGEKVMEYNGFDRDIRYLKNCTYRKEASAVGAAKHFFSEFIKNI